MNLNYDSDTTDTLVTSVFDSLGVTHDVTLAFTKTSTTPLLFDVRVLSGSVSGATVGFAPELGRGVVPFDGERILSAYTVLPFTVSFPGAEPDQHVTIDFGDPDQFRTTAFSTAAALWTLADDGHAFSEYHFGLDCL
ncbi:MAG TPA: flagellar basal body FlgE domain-containing protein [Polyangiaceae bacterium]|nr:flagellar basal body FlgE domain-containing protein [Polyangiaceae bacterium]